MAGVVLAHMGERLVDVRHHLDPRVAPATRCRNLPALRRTGSRCQPAAPWRWARPPGSPCARSSEPPVAAARWPPPSSCTSRVSRGVAGGGRCTLAFSMTARERARSALSSTKIWLIPNPPMMTGMELFSLQSCEDPRRHGDDHVHVAVEAQQLGHQRPVRVVDVLHRRLGQAGRRQGMLDHPHQLQVGWKVSRPPRSRMLALPVLRQRLAMSMVTLGRAS